MSMNIRFTPYKPYPHSPRTYGARIYARTYLRPGFKSIKFDVFDCPFGSSLKFENLGILVWVNF